MRLRRTSGVSPTVSRIESLSARSSCCALLRAPVDRLQVAPDMARLRERRQGDQRARSRAPAAPRRAHAREHAEQRLGGHEVARVAGEAGLRGDGDDQHVRDARERERAQHRRRAPPRDQRRHRERGAATAELLDRVPQHGQERHVGELRRSPPRRSCARVEPAANRPSVPSASGSSQPTPIAARPAPAPTRSPRATATARRGRGTATPPAAAARRRRRARAPAAAAGEVRDHAPQHRGRQPALRSCRARC